MPGSAALLLSMLARRITPAALAWLEAELAQAPVPGPQRAGAPPLASSGGSGAPRPAGSEGPSRDVTRVLSALSAAARRVGRGVIVPSAEESTLAERAGVEQPLYVYTTDELARGLLLDSVGSDLAVDVVRRAYADGDNHERRAVLRALPLLRDPEAHLALAIDACRSHVTPIFEAIACDNLYPGRYFPEAAFNQLALKVAFVELPLSRVLLLAQRRNAELDRMTRDYRAEREVARRTVPSDLGLLLLGDGEAQATS